MAADPRFRECCRSRPRPALCLSRRRAHGPQQRGIAAGVVSRSERRPLAHRRRSWRVCAFPPDTGARAHRQGSAPHRGLQEHHGRCGVRRGPRAGVHRQPEPVPVSRLVSDQKIRETLRFMGRTGDEPVTPDVAAEVCQRANAKALLAGSIAAIWIQLRDHARRAELRNRRIDRQRASRSGEERDRASLARHGGVGHADASGRIAGLGAGSTCSSIKRRRSRSKR